MNRHLAPLRSALGLIPALLLPACGSTSDEGPAGAGGSSAPGEPATAGTGSDSTPPRPEGLSEEGDEVYFKTSEFSLEPGEERFLCYAATIEEDVVVDRFDYDANSVVHHFLLARTLAPEPEGLSECDVLFRFTWQPLFGAGTSGVSLQIPEGAGQHVTAGTQVIIQLHLLNSSPDPVTTAAEIAMHRTNALDLSPVGLFTIGNPNIHLPPGQASTVEAQCTLPQTVEMFAVIPHMHYLGQRMRLSNGPSPSELEQIFLRDPYDFDDQTIEQTTLTLPAGSTARVECDFENVYDHEVQFGESSLDEMCYLVGFAPGFDGFKGCQNELAVAVDPVPNDPAAGTCGEHTPTPTGIGSPCTGLGGDCPNTLSCTTDRTSTSGEPGICISTGCQTSAECGDGGGVCCTAEGSGINVCTHEACRDPGCIPVD